MAVTENGCSALTCEEPEVLIIRFPLSALLSIEASSLQKLLL